MFSPRWLSWAVGSPRCRNSPEGKLSVWALPVVLASSLVVLAPGVPMFAYGEAAIKKSRVCKSRMRYVTRSKQDSFNWMPVVFSLWELLAVAEGAPRIPCPPGLPSSAMVSLYFGSAKAACTSAWSFHRTSTRCKELSGLPALFFSLGNALRCK